MTETSKLDRTSNFKRTLSHTYGGETTWESHIRSVKLVANALNKGDMAKAMMTAVLMRLPDPGDPIRIADEDGVLAKGGFDPDEPRDERGRWTNGGDVAPYDPSRPAHPTRRRRMSDASNDPVAEAVARAAEAQHSLKPASATGQSRSTNGQESLWQTLRSKLPTEAQSLLSTIARAQADESRVNLTAAAAELSTIADTLKAYADYRAQPWIGPDGRPAADLQLSNGQRQRPGFQSGTEFVRAERAGHAAGHKCRSDLIP